MKDELQYIKICWVSSEWFADVDIPIIPLLLKRFRIHWIIILYKGGRFSEQEFERFSQLDKLSIEFIHVNQRARDFGTNVDYWKLYFSIMRTGADLNYIDIAPGSPYLAIPYNLLPANRTIYAAHDGSIKSIMGRMVKYMFRLNYGLHSKYIHMFSKNQAEEFKSNYPGKKITVIPLMPKDYGKPTNSYTHDVVSFISFGTMHAEKNIGLLIQAAEELFDEGISDFKVSICGKAPSDWDQIYGKFIKHPQLFNLQLRMIENQEIPNLFNSHSFAVYPYKMMSQSGALKVAYAYKKPVIVSDLPAFREEVKEGVNGFFFESECIESLKNVMRKCIKMRESEYNFLIDNTSKYIDDNYSKDVIMSKYIDMFEEVLNQ